MGCIIDELKELIEEGTKEVLNKTAKAQIDSFIKALEAAKPKIDPETLQLNMDDNEDVIEEARVVNSNRTAQMNARNERIEESKDSLGWSKYKEKLESVNGKYNNYYGAMEKVIIDLVNPKVIPNVVGLMLEEVFNGKFDVIVAGDYDPNTHTVQIAGKPSQLEVEFAVKEGLETVGLELFEMTEDNLDRLHPLLKEFVDINTAKVLTKIVADIESINGGHTATHEMIHAGALSFMRNNPEHEATIRINELYKEAMDNADNIRSMVRENGVYSTYWQKNVEEFLAEALSNPGLMYALSNIKTVGKEKLSKGLFAELVESLIKMLGLSKKTEDNLLEFTMDGFAAIMEAQAVKANVPVDKELRKLVKARHEIQNTKESLIAAKAEKEVKAGTITDKQKVAEEVISKLTKLTKGKDMKSIQAIINKIKEC